MIVHNYSKLPAEGSYSGYVVSELQSYELDKLTDLGIDEIWYWYGQGSYEGSGEMLYRKGQLFGIQNMSHCSCFGPLDGLDTTKIVPLDDLHQWLTKVGNDLGYCLEDFIRKAQQGGVG